MNYKEIIIMNLILSKIKCTEIAKYLNEDINHVYHIKRKYNLLVQKQNYKMTFNEKQEQLLLSGKIGDGNYKKNGKSCYFRISHSEKDLDFLNLSYKIFDSYVSKGGILETTSAGFNKEKMYCFSTKSSIDLLFFKNLSIEKTILKLNDFGLVLLILDDGWKSNNSIQLSSGKLTKEQILLLISQFEKFGFKNISIVGKRNDIYFSTINNNLFKESIYKYNLENLNIVKRKILTLK